MMLKSYTVWKQKSDLVSFFTKMCLLSDCFVPLLLQHFWDYTVVPSPVHAPPNPLVEGLGKYNSQVQMVCHSLSSPLLPTYSINGLWFIHGWLAIPCGHRRSHLGGLACVDHHQCPTNQVAPLAASKAPKLGLPPQVDALLAAMG